LNNTSICDPNDNQTQNHMEKRLTFDAPFLMMGEQSETDREREKE